MPSLTSPANQRVTRRPARSASGRRPTPARRRALLPAVLALAAASAVAQTPPDAGRLLDEQRQPTRPLQPPPAAPNLVETPVRPPAQMPEGLTVLVSGFRITGARSFPEELLAALVQPFAGKRLDIRGLNDAAGAITRHYQANGHLLSYAYLPEQRVADGPIEIAVMEGRLDAAQVVTAQDVRLRDSVVQAHAEVLTARQPVLQADVERQLLLLNDMPGVVARGVFTPGAAPGAADLVVSVAEDEPLQWRADVDNQGSRSTGVLRAGVGVQLRDVFGFGEQLSARLQAGQAGGLVSGSLSGLLPVGGQGWKLGASVSHLTYELAGSFRALGAWGKADSAGLELQYAALRSASANVALRAAWESRHLTDEIQFQPERSRHKRNEVFTFGVTADRRDDWAGGGSTLAAFTVTAGDLRLLDDAATAADAASLGTARHYRKLLGQVGRQQALAGPVSAYVRLLGQATGGNLDSVEKLSLGGAYGVRAYAPGEAAVDQGGLATIELRWQLDYLGGGVTLSLFHDRGEGLVNRQPLSLAGNYAKLYGSGLGLAWSRGDWSLSTSLAWRGGREPQADGGDPRPRLYFQLSASP